MPKVDAADQNSQHCQGCFAVHVHVSYLFSSNSAQAIAKVFLIVLRLVIRHQNLLLPLLVFFCDTYRI
ncbi:MAG: hypothetical protein ACKO3K_17200 [Cuspidothrix sp.]